MYNRIVMAAGSLVLREGGVIRAIDNWGVFTLPRAISRHQQLYHNGHYFVMRYDAGMKTQEEVRDIMRLDPRVIRSTSVKLGDGKLETLSKFGQVNWLQST